MFLFNSLMVPAQHFSQVEVWQVEDFEWALAAPWSFCFQPYCCRLAAEFGSLFCCILIQFSPSFSCQTDGLIFESRILWFQEGFMVNSVTAGSPDLLAAEQAQTNHSFTTMLGSWYEFMRLYSLILINHGAVHEVKLLLCPKDIAIEVYWFIQILFWKSRLWFSFRTESFSYNLSKQAILFSIFLSVQSQHLTC